MWFVMSLKNFNLKRTFKKLNIACISKDSLKSALYDELNILTNYSYKLYFNLAEEQIKNWVDIIIESTFTYEDEINILNKWKNIYDIDIFCIICNVDNKIREKRIKNRERHICHKDADKKALENLKKESFNSSKLIWKLININTDNELQKIIDEVLKEID